MGQEIAQRAGHDLDLGGLQGTGEDASGHEIDDPAVVGGVLAEEILGEDACDLDEGDVVEGGEGLERGVGAFAEDGAGLAAGGVEDVHERGWCGALPEGVEAAAIQGVAGIALVAAGVALGHGDGFPDAFRLVGFDAGTADGGVEQVRDGEGVIADHFGIHAEAWAAGEKAVGGIAGDFFGGDGGGLAIGGGGDHEPEQVLDIPATGLEFDGEPVEQLLVDGILAHDAEVIDGPDEAGAEDFLPEAVDGDAGGEGVFRGDDPLGETEAIGGRTFGHGMQDGEGAGGDGVAGLVVLAPEQDAGDGHGIHALALHVGYGAARLDGFPFGLEAGEFVAGLEETGVPVEEVEFEQGIGMGGGPTFRWQGEKELGGGILGEGTDFVRVQDSGIDPDILHLAVLEELILAALTDAQGNGGADGVGEGIGFAAGTSGATIDEDPQAGGFGGAVVGDEDMLPFAGTEGIVGGDDLEGVGGPAVDQVDGVIAVVGEEIPTAVIHGLIHPGENGLEGAAGGNPDPGAVTEGLIPFEIGDVTEVRGGVGGEDCGGTESAIWIPLGRLDGGGLGCGTGMESEPVAFALVQQGMDNEVGSRRGDAEGIGSDPGQPGFEVGPGIRTTVGEALLYGGDLVGEGLPTGAVGFRVGDDDAGVGILDVAIETTLGGVPEVRGHGIEIAGWDGIELVVVADGAIGGETEPDPGGGLDTVTGVVGQVFLLDRAALVGGGVASVESSGDELVVGGVREEITGELFNRESVEGLVGVEGPDHPVAVRPHLPVIVEVQTVGVGVAGGIKPVPAAMFAPGRRSHELSDVGVQGLFRAILDEGFHRFG